MMYRPEMYRSWIKTLVFGSLGLTCSLVADFSLAQTQNAETVFGQAVHQYFGGQYQEAVDDLSVALEAGIEDPRLYYYRGLSQLQMGDQAAAEADFAMGAEIEAQYAGRRNFNIGRSLMRVQGATRMMIENARAQARLQSEELVNQSRPVNRRQALNLLQQRAATNSADASVAESMPAARPNLPDLSNVVDPTAPFSDNVPLPPPRTESNENDPIEEPAGNDPFGQPAEAEPADEPFNVPENTQPADDPFAEPADTPADEPADDPFGQPSDQPADEPAMEEPATDPFSQPTEDPFPPSNNPFSEPAGNETPTPAADPFAEPAEATGTGNNSTTIPANVRGGKVLSGLFGALAAPVRKAANAGANAMQNLPGGLPGQQPPAGFDEPDFGEQPGGNPFGNEDPFK